MLNAFKYKRIHKIVKGNAIKLISIEFSKKEKLRLVNNKFFEKIKRKKITNENIINLKLAFRLNLSSRNPIKKNKVKKIKKIKKSKLLKLDVITFK